MIRYIRDYVWHVARVADMDACHLYGFGFVELSEVEKIEAWGNSLTSTMAMISSWNA